MKFSKKELKKLSANGGLKYLLSSERPDFKLALKSVQFNSEIRDLQIALIKLQNWVVANNKRILIIFEGGEFCGKGIVIRRIMQRLNPRSARTVALPKPSKIEKGQWYFQRYIEQLPKPGEMTFFNRSWYNRAVVEPVNGFCTKKQYNQFMSVVNDFERMIHNDGIIIRKLFFTLDKEVQAERIADVRKNPLRRWELSRVDENAQSNWDKYELYQKKMFERTNTKQVNWKIIDGNDELQAQTDAILYILSSIPFE